MEGSRRVHLRIKGRVQGVFYRQSAKEEADRLGLRGWIKNLPGGDVEAMCEGPQASLDAFIYWARRGPPAASVAELNTDEGQPEGELPSPFAVVR